ncbi:MAG: hypothetical protein RLZZ04_2381, partial [Cyanobacteriota bacterium]
GAIATLLTLAIPGLVWADGIYMTNMKTNLTQSSINLLTDPSRTPGVQPGDVVEYVLEAQVANAPAGPNVYLTAYIPNGVEVLGAWFVTDATGATVRTPGQGGQANDGWGARDSKTPFGNPFAGSGNSRQSDLDGDTGIFYSTDTRTKLFTADGSNIAKGPIGDPTNTSGTSNGYNVQDTFYKAIDAFNLWDANQVNAFGRGGTLNAIPTNSTPTSSATIINSVGQGSTPFGSGSTVAGPDTGYTLDNTGIVGPWNRIQYSGSKKADILDGPATAEGTPNTATLLDASSIGRTLNDAAPLPSNTNAVRWSDGLRTLNETVYVKIRVRINAPAITSTTGALLNFEANGSDNWATTLKNNILISGSKDNPWRYFGPTVGQSANLSVKKEIYKVNGSLYSGGAVPAGSTITYRVRYANLGNLPVNNISFKDTLPTAIATAGCTGAVPTLSGLSNSTTISSVTSGTAPCPGSAAIVTFDNLPNVTSGSLHALRGGEFTYDLKISPTATNGTVVANNATMSGQDVVVSGLTVSTPTTSSATIGSPIDYGDAPDTYGTDATNNNGEGIGANHIIVNTLKLGVNAPDFEIDAQTPLDGTGDGADEDGITSFPNLYNITTSYSVTATVSNTSGSPANVYGWIDFDRDGKFDGDERATVSNGTITLSNGKVPTGSNGNVTLTWNNIGGTGANINNGNSYARIRLTTDTLSAASATTSRDSASVGNATNGEVEDYPIAIGASPISPFAGQLVINEVLYAQSNNLTAVDNDEFIELFNPSSNTINLSGFKLIDGNLLVSAATDPNALDGTVGSITGSQSPYVFPNGTILQPGQYAVIWIGNQTAEHSAIGATFQAWLSQSPKLNNAGDDVWLYDANTKVIDYMAYGLSSSGAINTRPSFNFWNSTYENKLDDPLPGQSISLTPNGIDGNSSACWEKTAILTTDPDSASGRCTGFLNTVDTDIAFIAPNQRITSVGKNNNQIIQDYGDAPTGYEGTNSARHNLSTNLYLGNVFPDTETAAQSSANADGDDAVAAPNLDDEDGISSFPTLTTNTTSYSLTTKVNNPSGLTANVYAWIDFDRDQKFDQDEQATVVNISASGSVTLNWNNIGSTGANIINGGTSMRIRLTTSNLDQTTETTQRDDASIGLAANGEVEDYPIAIAKTYDYGDAPNFYGDASHDNPATPTVYIGATKPDQESGTQLGNDAGAAAAGDDNNGTPDDEDAFATLPNVSTIDNYDIIVPVTNTSGSPATLHAWVDFDKDGKFETGEYQNATVANNSTSANLNWSIPSGTTPGDTYIRFRLTTASLTNNATTNAQDERSIGNAINGEVEDYKVAIEPVPSLPPSSVASCEVAITNGSFESPALSNTLPTPYQTFVPNKIAAYNENDVPGWTSFADSYIELWRNGNNIDGNPLAYEGEQFAEINAYVNGSLYQDVYTIPGSVITWQFAHRGRVGVDTMNLKIGSPGATVAQINPTNGTTSFQTGNTAWVVYQGTYTVPAGQTTTRFEYQAVATATGDQGVGNFIDAVRFGPLCDHGDAKSGYPVLRNNNGAAHINDGVSFLGSKVRIELDGQPSAAANGDDGIVGDVDQIDDEDGVTFTSTLNTGRTASMDVVASVPGYLNAWIDFNQDNDWDDSGEKVFTDRSLNAGTNNLSLTIPANANIGNTFARFRFSTNTGINPTGIVASGEVEDYQIAIAQPIASDPNLLLVKRITAINPGRPGEIQFNNFIDDTGTTNDNNSKWPDSDGSPNNNINEYLRGVSNSSVVKPGDEVEYTIYFLSNGDVNAKEVKICDAVPDHMTFVKNTYGVELGIGLGFDSTALPTSPNLKLSNLLNDDQGDFYAPGNAPPANLCKKVTPANTLVNVNGTNNDNGAVVVKIQNLPKANTPGSPKDSYGFVRFRGKVK